MPSATKGKTLRRGIFLALLTAMALLLNSFDMALTLPFPAFRIGLSHILTITALLTLGRKEAFFVVFFKVVFTALIWGTLASPSFFIAVAGNGAALLFLLAGFKRLSLIPLSVGGAFFNNLGQILVVYFFFIPRKELLWYFFLMLLGGALTGAVIGAVAGIIIRRVRHAGMDL